jgi:hypothetical protein
MACTFHPISITARVILSFTDWLRRPFRHCQKQILACIPFVRERSESEYSLMSKSTELQRR